MSVGVFHDPVNAHSSGHGPQALIACNPVVGSISSKLLPERSDPGGVARVECVQPLFKDLKNRRFGRRSGIRSQSPRKHEKYEKSGDTLAHTAGIEQQLAICEVDNCNM
jgi:hypothetical protein